MYSYLYSVSLCIGLGKHRNLGCQESEAMTAKFPTLTRFSNRLDADSPAVYIYMEHQIREAHSTLLVLQNQAHNALAKPSPSDLGAERLETFPKDVATQRINYPRRLAARSSGEPAASWRWPPRR